MKLYAYLLSSPNELVSLSAILVVAVSDIIHRRSFVLRVDVGEHVVVSIVIVLLLLGANFDRRAHLLAENGRPTSTRTSRSRARASANTCERQLSLSLSYPLSFLVPRPPSLSLFVPLRLHKGVFFEIDGACHMWTYLFVEIERDRLQRKMARVLVGSTMRALAHSRRGGGGALTLCTCVSSSSSYGRHATKLTATSAIVCKATKVQRHGFTDLTEQDGSTKAAALIIGNEILNGQIADTNLPWLAKMLYNRGKNLIRAEFVPDDEVEIAETLLKLKERVGEGGIIFTSGGIGPTHDDVTYDAVARAFKTTTEEHAETIRRMKEHYLPQGKEVNEARKRMARLPKGCDVLYTPGTWVPLAVIEDTYILPGIPKLFQKMLKAQESQFRGPLIFSQTIFTDSGEGDLAASLTAIAEKYPNVDIGSYPNTRDDSYVTKLVLHSRQPEVIEEACKDITSLIPKCWQ